MNVVPLQLSTTKKYPLQCCLHHFIQDQVVKTPNAVALTFEDESLSYAELNARSNYLANLLKLQGVKPDTTVGVCFDRSVEMVIALLAVLKADGAYMPLDPTLPAKRLAYMVDESKAPLVLVQSKFKNLFAPPVKLLDLNDPVHTGQSDKDNPGSKCRSNNLAYVIYTSGSTGTPKGVMNQHDGIVNRLLWMQDEFQISENDTVLQKTPYSFDVSVWEFFWPLMVGARLVIARPDGHKDPDYLLDLINTENITVIHFVPSMLRLFLQTNNLERSRSLRYVICSGEALDIALHNQFFNRCTAALYNLYGPTEAAVDVTYWRCSLESKLEYVPIGYPITPACSAIGSPHCVL